MADPRCLIVNADDFGLSPGVNRGVALGFEDGIVTSASLMVRPVAVTAAVDYAQRHPRLSVGLHVDLGEWVYRDGGWEPVYSVVKIEDEQAVADEVYSQLELFRRFMHRNPTHLDSHQHVHRRAVAKHVLQVAARELRIPLRHFTPTIVHCGRFYGQTNEGEPLTDSITAGHLVEILESLQAGVTELVCHPGVVESLASTYRTERPKELETLCDPCVRDAITQNGIQLCSFHDIDPAQLTAQTTR